MFEITAERPQDGAAIEALLDQAFGADRHAKISYGYRAGVAPDPRLRLVAREPGRIVGTIRYWPVRIGGATPALLLGPLAVAGDRRSGGIGAALIGRSLGMAAQAGHRIVLLVGDLDYYRRFGFRPAAPYGLVMPREKPERLLVTELAPGALDRVSGDLLPWRRVRRRLTGGHRGAGSPQVPPLHAPGRRSVAAIPLPG